MIGADGILRANRLERLRTYFAFPPNFSAVRMAPRPSSDSSTLTSVSVLLSSGISVTCGKKFTVTHVRISNKMKIL